MKVGVFFCAQAILVSAVVLTPITGLTTAEADAFATLVSSEVRLLQKELAAVEQKLNPPSPWFKWLQPSTDGDVPGRPDAQLIEEPLELLKAKQLKLVEKLKEAKLKESRAVHLQQGAATLSEERLAKIAKIKAGFLASKPAAELVNLQNPRIKVVIGPVEYLPGLTPGEAKWHWDNLVRLQNALSEQVQKLKAEKSRITSAISSNSLDQIDKLPKALQSQLKPSMSPSSKLQISREYLEGLDQVLSTTEAKLGAADIDLQEAKGFSIAAQHVNKNLVAAAKSTVEI